MEAPGGNEKCLWQKSLRGETARFWGKDGFGIRQHHFGQKIVEKENNDDDVDFDVDVDDVDADDVMLMM